MLNKKGDTTLSDIFSILLTVLLLVMLVAVSFLDVFGKKDNKLELENVNYGDENIFVIESYLKTNSDLLNLYLVDETKKDQLEEKTRNIFDKVYGSCYGFEIKDIKINELSDKKTCIDYPTDEELCLDISEYDEKMEAREVAKCFE
nr:hypothetical protein [Nanoarchaeum sp.]